MEKRQNIKFQLALLRCASNSTIADFPSFCWYSTDLPLIAANFAILSVSITEFRDIALMITDNGVIIVSVSIKFTSDSQYENNNVFDR